MPWTRRHLLLAAGAIAAGAVLRWRAFTLNLPLSLDEAALAKNLMSRDWLELLAPLDHAQLAPPGFLLAEKAAVAMLGGAELALRAVPLIASLAALLLCLTIARRMFEPAAGLTALALTALSRPLIEYSAVAKPYSTDVAATFAVLLLVLGQNERPRPGLPWRRAAAAAAVALCSFPAVFVIAAGGVPAMASGILSNASSDRRRRWVAGAIWIVAALPALAAGRHMLTGEDRAYMQWFWSAGFPPVALPDAAVWLWRRSIGIFGQTAGLRFATIWAAIAAMGLWSLWRRGRRHLAVHVSATAAAVVVAAALREYPFEPGRLLLFLLPIVVFLAGEGSAAIGRLLPGRVKGSIVVPALAVSGAAFLVMPPAPSAPLDSVRPFVDVVVRERQPGDAIYVYHWVALPFGYYAERAGLPADAYAVGRCAHGSVRSYFREIDRLRGRSRVWLALPHRRDPELNAIRGYLDGVGRRLPGFDRSDLGYLYDLSQGVESGVTADRYPVPPELDGNSPARWSCHGVFDASP